MQGGAARPGRGRALVKHPAVGDDDAFGVARSARGIEQGHRVGRRDRRDPAGHLGSCGACRGLFAQLAESSPAQESLPRRASAVVADDDLLQAGQVGKQRLPAGQLVGAVDDGDPHVTISGHVLDLVGGERGVEGDRHSPGLHDSLVGQQVLKPVRQHHRHPLPRLQAKFDQPGRQLAGQVGELAPAQRVPRIAAVPVGIGGQVAVLGDGGGKHVAQRATADLSLDRGPFLKN